MHRAALLGPEVIATVSYVPHSAPPALRLRYEDRLPVRDLGVRELVFVRNAFAGRWCDRIADEVRSEVVPLHRARHAGTPYEERCSDSVEEVVRQLAEGFGMRSVVKKRVNLYDSFAECSTTMHTHLPTVLGLKVPAWIAT